MMEEANGNDQGTGLEIAVIGMSARFPGAKNIDEFWENLRNGIESITFFSDEELEEASVSSQLLKNPAYVKAKGVIEDIYHFDASFFNYIPREAETLDPQHRLFHECVWEALEIAGYDPYSYQGLIGLYGGAAANPFWESVFLTRAVNPSEVFSAGTLFHKDFLSSRTSYKLGLKGTTFCLFTACSTSLVTVHLACNGILSGECDMALAGGASISFPQKTGYLCEEGMILSSDGHNRTFDEAASGSVFGDGVGVVLLKRLEDAAADRDTIDAVIKGSAINNDGNRKVGFTAPSVEGQVEVIRAAMAMAEVEPGSISYLEAHGTATPLGDAAEMEALNRVFANGNMKTGSCPIGSVKSNFGHLNVAAGISGLIKTILALKHQLIPPSLHFKTLNSSIDFENSPFYVNTQLTPWKREKFPRRAGVSSFGIGGTNAHLVLEEAPKGTRAPLSGEEGYQLILLSAKSPTALDKMTENLAQYLEKNPGINLADAAYTLQVGRQELPHRRMVTGTNPNQVLEALTSSPTSRKVHTFFTREKKKGVVFMFAGLGNQYVNMGRQLYEKEPLFQEEMNRCFEILKPLMDCDIKEILYPEHTPALTSHPSQEGSVGARGGSLCLPKDCVGSPGQGDHRGSPLQSALPSGPGDSPLERGAPDLRKGRGVSDIEIAQLVVFVIEYALARLLMKWGIRPSAVIGYSFGEYAAACIAGGISLEDALTLVVSRGQLMSQVPAGAMISVPLPIRELEPMLETHEELSICIDNGASCIIGGPAAAIEVFEKQVKEKRLICVPLQTSHAVHSKMMESILPQFREAINKIALNKPGIPYVSNLTGDWIKEQEAVDPEYWVRHLRETVRFSDGLARLLKKEDAVFLEIGPGRALGTHLQQHEGSESKRLVINCLRHPEEPIPDTDYLLDRIGHLWLWGVKIDWRQFYSHERRYRVPLPTYPFERQLFWQAIPSSLSSAADTGSAAAPAPCKQPDISRWFYHALWKASELSEPDHEPGADQTPSHTLMFIDDSGLGLQLAEGLSNQGFQVTFVKKGLEFACSKQPNHPHTHTYTIDPGEPDHYHRLLKEIQESHRPPGRIFHLWGINDSRGGIPGIEVVNDSLEICFYSVLYLARALVNQHLLEEIQLLVLTNNMQDVSGEELLCPEKAVVPVTCKVVSQEYSSITCRSIDIVLPGPGTRQRKRLVHRLLQEVTADAYDLVVAYRGSYRWVQFYEPISMPSGTRHCRLRPGGVYLITGGLGGVGHVLAQYLADTLKAKLILTGRTAVPVKDQWNQWLLDHLDDDPVSLKIKKLQELEALGAEVLTFSADAAEEPAMRNVISRAEERFGPINGVIHTAGITGIESSCIIAEMDKRQCQLNFQPKIYGLLVLERLLRGKPLDFCLLTSSISSVLGGLALASYSAANLFMDMFTRLINRESPVPWISVSWDGWRTSDVSTHEQGGFSAAAWENFAMTPEEGIESVRRVLSLEEPDHGHLVHSTGDLQARIEQWLNLENLRQKHRPTGEEQATSYARPSLSTPYIAPSSQLEEIIADAWQKFLRIDQVGIEDNFFDLNATSLDIVQVNNILKDVLKKDIPVVTMFNYPTVGSLARFLAQQDQEAGETDLQEETDRGEVMEQSQERMRIMRNSSMKV